MYVYVNTLIPLYIFLADPGITIITAYSRFTFNKKKSKIKSLFHMRERNHGLNYAAFPSMLVLTRVQAVHIAIGVCILKFVIYICYFK